MNNEISIATIWQMLKRTWKFILIVTLIAMLLTGLFTHFFIEKQYSSSVKFYVINTNEDQDFDQTALVSVKEQLAKEYIEIILSDVMIDPLIAELKAEHNISYTPSQIRGMISAPSVSEIGIFDIKVTSLNPEHSYIIAKLIADEAPSIVKAVKKPGAKNTLDCISVLNQPVKAARHSSPNLVKNVMLAGIFAVAVMCVIFLLIALFDRIIKTEDDVKRITTKYPIIGSIPSWYNKSTRKLENKKAIKINKKSKKPDDMSMSDNYSLINKDTPFAVTESFSHLRNSILYTPKNSDSTPVFCVVSASENSGKSTVVANLAFSFANISKRVLLIDGDMRCPVQQKFFGYKKYSTGLSEILSGIVKDKSEAIVKTDNEYLDIIPSGHIPPNPSELIINHRFGELIAELKQDYDYIFVDFPPIGVVSDALNVAKHIDGYIFVIRANISNSISVKKSFENTENIGGNIVGICLNDVSYKEAIYGGRYSGRYGGRYNKIGTTKSNYDKYSKYIKYEKVKEDTQ